MSSGKLLDWFIVNVVKPGPHAEELRVHWKDGDELTSLFTICLTRLCNSAIGEMVLSKLRPRPFPAGRSFLF